MSDERHTVTSVSPHTQALSLYIQDAVQRLRNGVSQATDRQDEEQQSSLIFFGNWQDPFPRLLVTDPVLEPVDKVVWQIIRIHISTPGAVTAFPSYSAIRSGANIKSNHTVSRAITILRVTRWLSLCARVRDAQGRFLGNIYALHDEPVTLGDAMYLDRDYIEFLRSSRDHKHLRVSRIARSVLATIQDMIDAGQDTTGERVQTRAYERRIGVMTKKQRDSAAAPLSKPNPFYALSEPHIAALNEQPSDPDTPLQNLHTDETKKQVLVQKTHMEKNDKNRVQNSHSDANFAQPPTQNSHTGVCSSSNNINIYTTTTNKPDSRACARPSESLHFPPRVSVNERNLAMMYLKTIEDAQRQDVLDEWHGRLNSAGKRGAPIDNPIGYLAVLCRRAKTGEFQLTIGLRIREIREREQEHKRRLTETEKRNDEQTRELLQKHSGSSATRMTQRLEEIRNAHRKKQESET